MGISNKKVEAVVGHLRFFSATYRLFKLPGGVLESDCEDYGQAVRYKGTLPQTRFAPHFDFFGDRSTHYGIFPDCGKGIPFASAAAASSSGASSSGGCC